jgi:hypothetical protein
LGLWPLVPGVLLASVLLVLVPPLVLLVLALVQTPPEWSA